jgi:hypothetical protein
VLGKLSGRKAVSTHVRTYTTKNDPASMQLSLPCLSVCLLFLCVSAASIVLGKLSGRKAVSTRLEQLGFGLSAEEVNDVFKRFKVRGIACCSSIVVVWVVIIVVIVGLSS